MDLDKDLLSRQEARELLKQASAAQRQLAQMSQQQLDTIVKSIADAIATVAPPMEIPPMKIFTSSPKRSTKYFVHAKQSLLSLMPNVMTCPSLLPLAR